MNLRKNLSLILSFFLAMSSTVTGSSISLYNELNPSLLSFITHSNDLMQRNPSRSLDCLNYYIPIIRSMAEKYQKDIDICIETAESRRTEAEAATLDKRNELANRASSSCKLLTKCNNIKTAVELFQCYVTGALENSENMRNINTDASEYLNEFQENIGLINNVENKCTNDTKRNYEVDSAKVYSDLNNCILGITETTETPATNPHENLSSSESIEEDTEDTDFLKTIMTYFA